MLGLYEKENLLERFSLDEMLAVYTDTNVGVSRICLHENHVNKDNRKRSMTASVFTLSGSGSG